MRWFFALGVLIPVAAAQDKSIAKICSEFDTAWANAKNEDAQLKALELLRQKTDPEIRKRLVNVMNNYKASEAAREQAIRTLASNYRSDQTAVAEICKFIEKRDKRSRKKDSVLEMAIRQLGQMDRKVVLPHAGVIDDIIETEVGEQYETAFGLAAVQVAPQVRSKTTIPKLIKLYRKLQNDMRSYFQANFDKNCDGG